jgi:hypothetical protein
MTAAIFALAGTLIGVFGTLAVALARSRAEDKRSHRDALRLACADFTAAVARMVNDCDLFQGLEKFRKQAATSLGILLVFFAGLKENRLEVMSQNAVLECFFKIGS